MTPDEGNATTYEHNGAGDVTSITDGNGNETTFGYDELHRQTSVTYPDVGAGAKSRTASYTCCGEDTVTDENGKVTKYGYYAGTRQL